MRKIAVFIAFIMIFMSCAAVVSAGGEMVRISEAEINYLSRAIAVSYPKISYGGRVAIAAVVLNRMETVGFPDSACGAVMSLVSEGEFSAVYEVAGKIDSKTVRLSSDAVEAAISGADPTGGALYFESVGSEKWHGDLLFNDSAEDQMRRTMENYFLQKYGEAAVIIDNIGFLGRNDAR
ncbi:MAG: cell wall hydrolase [Ruminococcaceae bacterium]|nr:cell wall hydrolase [Oscillospiraceae bacterium]